MTNTDLVEFKTIYPDIERYLAEDCYVPNEVRDSRTGISCIQVPANNDEALSITKESLIKLLSLIGCE